MPRASGRWGDDEYLAAGPRWEYHCVAAASGSSVRRVTHSLALIRSRLPIWAAAAERKALCRRSPELPKSAEVAILNHMVDKSPPLESLTAQERIVRMGRLWDSLDAAAAAPLSPALVTERARRN